MDECKGRSVEIEEWMKELLPDGAAEIGMWQHSQHASVQRSNTYQLSLDSNTYSCNLNQHQLVQMSTVKPEPFNVLQHHAGQTTLQKILETQSGMAPERNHPRMQMPAFHQSQNLTLADQQKPGNQASTMFLGTLQASSDSTPQVDLTNFMDWFNQAFHKVQQMKEMYLSDLHKLHNRTKEHRLRATNVETVNKYETLQTLLERIIRFLNVPRSDLSRWKKDVLYQTINETMKNIHQLKACNLFQLKQTQQVEASANHLDQPHQIHQRENYIHPPSLNMSLRQGGPLNLPQTSLNSFKVSSSMGNASLYSNPMRPTQQWAPQGSVVPSPYKGPQTGFDQRALRMLLHPSTGVSQHNNSCASQQTVAFSRNIFNSLEYSVNPVAQMSPVSMSSSLNNQQDQAMKRQKMKQPVQQFVSERNKPQMLQKRNEDNKLRRFVGYNQRWSPVLPQSSSLYTISPQHSQQSSSQLELKDLSSKFSKSATPSQSASPSTLPSPLTPLTPLTPSSNPADSVKSPLVEENTKLTKTNATPINLSLLDKNQSQVAIDTQKLSKSCLHKDSTCSGDKQSSYDKGDPLKHLVEVVKAISSKALNATLQDITAVTNLTDRVAGQFLDGDPTKVIFHDLADDISNPENGLSSLEQSTQTKSRMKREMDCGALNDSMTEMEFYEIARVKRLKIEANNTLLQEIKEMNKKLIEVVVDLMHVEDVSKTGFDEGTLVRCSYIPIGFSRNIKTPNTSKFMFPNLLLDLIVPADYPNSSPTVLEKMPSGFSDCEEGQVLWMKAKSRFSLSLRKLSQPISVKEIAETWDVCAREVFHEFAEQMGGGNFSSTYGKWENFAVAG